MFVFAGYEPSTELVKDIAELNPQGYVVTNISKQTSKEGLFAAGDVCIKTLRQVVTATGDGAIAATEMEKYLSKERSRTGLETEMPIKRASVHKATDTAKDTSATKKSDNNELLDDDMKAQLMTVFDRMTSNLILEIYPDDRKVSLELKGYMEALASLTDKLSIKELDVANDETRPFVKVLKEDGTPSGITFHGAPGGHEFTSFVLGLYNAAGPGQGVPVDVKAKIDAIDTPTPITVMVSLSCTMCPELVTAAGRIATLNPNVQVDIFDLNHFPALKDKYNVMSVPCFVIGDKKPEFGKKNVEELVNLCSM